MLRCCIRHQGIQFAKTQSDVIAKKNGTYKPRPKRVKVEKSEPEAEPEADDDGDSDGEGEDEVAPAPAPVVKKKKINGWFVIENILVHALMPLACTFASARGVGGERSFV